MIMKSEMPKLPGKQVLHAHSGVIYTIISVRIQRWAGMVAVLRDADGNEQQWVIHNATWSPERSLYILGEA